MSSPDDKKSPRCVQTNFFETPRAKKLKTKDELGDDSSDKDGAMINDTDQVPIEVNGDDTGDDFGEENGDDAGNDFSEEDRGEDGGDDGGGDNQPHNVNDGDGDDVSLNDGDDVLRASDADVDDVHDGVHDGDGEGNGEVAARPRRRWSHPSTGWYEVRDEATVDYEVDGEEEELDETAYETGSSEDEGAARVYPAELPREEVEQELSEQPCASWVCFNNLGEMGIAFICGGCRQGRCEDCFPDPETYPYCLLCDRLVCDNCSFPNNCPYCGIYVCDTCIEESCQNWLEWGCGCERGDEENGDQTVSENEESSGNDSMSEDGSDD